MRWLLFFCFFLTYTTASSQSDRLKVFIDCSNTRCDMDYFRTEIDVVNFLLDRLAADVHVLITSQRTGGGGISYKMTFYGQNKFSDIENTIEFTTGPNATDYERRDQLAKHLKIGFVPFMIEIGAFDHVNINMKSGIVTDSLAAPVKVVDPWNFWVFRVGADGSINTDQNYKSLELSGEVSANRTTDKMKFHIELEYGQDNSTYSYTEDGEEVEINVNNHNYNLSNLLALTINDHWSYGYIGSISSSTFSNNERRYYFEPTIEYSLYPYSQVNNKFWTIRYGVDYRHNIYYDTTFFNEKEESLLGHGLEVNVQYNQKWGNVSGGIDAHTYFHDWELYNIGIFYEVEVRITGGLFVFTNLYAGLIHDQIYLPRGEATEEEVLTRQRQLQSSYSFWTNFGFNFRFGSNLSNFVNPRIR